MEAARIVILSSVPIEYQTIAWCGDCQRHEHQRCMDPTCHCEHSDHPALIPLTLRPKKIIGDAFWRATGGG